MEFNELLIKKGIPTKKVLLLRHRPVEPELNKVIKWLASERHEIFNASQQTQIVRVQDAMAKMSGLGYYVASFIGDQPGRALFVGLYSIDGAKKLTQAECYQIPAYRKMKGFAGKTIADDPPRDYILWFDLVLTDHYSSWKGKLVIEWRGERAWWRYADRNKMEVITILDESALDSVMPR
jgi:hypothetical protein